MMPVTALPAQPLPLPGLPAAPPVLDFVALLQGGPVAAPLPEVVENVALPVTVTLADVEMSELELEAKPVTEQPAQPLPAPPPILAMFQPPVQPVTVADPNAPLPKAEAAPVVDAPRLPETRLPEGPLRSAPATAAKPELPQTPKTVAAADVAPVKPEKAAAPVAQPIAPVPVVVTPMAPVAASAKPQPVAPAPREDEPAQAAIASLPVEAPRPVRATPALPTAAAPIDATAPAVPEAPVPPPPVEVQVAAAEAPVIEQATAPLPQAQPVAAAPVQRSDAPQLPIDTHDPRWIDQMAQQIADLADGDGRARFRLNPETLGSMEVTVRHTPDGISVRFEVESESTRTLIAHAEQRLQAEARANGLRIADTQVDLTGQGQRQNRETPTEQPLVAIRHGAESEPTPSAEAAPASARYA